MPPQGTRTSGYFAISNGSTTSTTSTTSSLQQFREKKALACLICLQRLLQDTVRGQLEACGHRQFCADCLALWLRVTPSCPLCKAECRAYHCVSGEGATPLAGLPGRRVAVEPVPCTQGEGHADGDAVAQQLVDTAACAVCGRSDQEEVLLLCDGCDGAAHTYCVGLTAVPEAEWYCEECEEPQPRPPVRLRDRRGTRRTRHGYARDGFVVDGESEQSSDGDDECWEQQRAVEAAAETAKPGVAVVMSAGKGRRNGEDGPGEGTGPSTLFQAPLRSRSPARDPGPLRRGGDLSPFALEQLDQYRRGK